MKENNLERNLEILGHLPLNSMDFHVETDPNCLEHERNALLKRNDEYVRYLVLLHFRTPVGIIDDSSSC